MRKKLCCSLPDGNSSAISTTTVLFRGFLDRVYPPSAGRASALARALAASVTRLSGDRIALIACNAISADCSISISRCISPVDSDTNEGSPDFLTVRGEDDSGLAVGFQSKLSHSRGHDDVFIRYSPVVRASAIQRTF